MTPETSLTSESISEAPGKDSGNSGMYLIPEFLKPSKADPGEPVRILLSEAVSRHLTATGESAFVVIGKASLPDNPGRWALHLVPVDLQLACQACEVATGQRKPGRRIIPPAIAEDALQGHPSAGNPVS